MAALCLGTRQRLLYRAARRRQRGRAQQGRNNMKKATAERGKKNDDSENIFTSSDYETQDEAAFAYNVAALVLEGPDAELNEGMNLTLERKKQIEQETLERLNVFLKLPLDFKFGKFPQLYGEKPSGNEVVIENGRPAIRAVSEESQ